MDPANIVGEAVRTYAQAQPQVEELARRLALWLTTVLDDAGINYLNVAWRGKGVASFAAKTSRTVGGRPLYHDPLRDITDQIGTRIITYVTSDVAAVADVVRDQFSVVDDKDLGQETANEGRFGYVSRHLQVALDPVWLGDLPVDVVRVPSAQIQIRTVLQHAWAEFEHDIRYKGTVPEALAPDLNRRFTLAAGLLELADREFEVIRDRIRERLPAGAPEEDASDPRIGTRNSRRSLPGTTRRPAGPVPTITRGSPGCSSNWGSPRCASSRACCPQSTPRPSAIGWVTSTRPAPSDGWTTPCSPCSGTGTSHCTGTRTGSTCCAPGWRSCTAAT